MSRLLVFGAWVTFALLAACSRSPGVSTENAAPTGATATSAVPIEGRYLFNGSADVVWVFRAETGVVALHKEPPGTFTADATSVTVTHADGATSRFKRVDADRLTSPTGAALIRESAALAANKPAGPAGQSDAAPAQAAAAGDSGLKEPTAVAPAVPAPPFDQYEAVSTGMQVLGQYYAHRPGAVDYETEIRSDNAYGQEHDGFKKRDILAKFSSQLDAAITDARAHPFVRLPAVSTLLPPFDFKTGTYDLSKLVASDQRFGVVDLTNARVRVRLADPTGFQSYQTKSEADARAIEAVVGKTPGRMVRMILYGQIVQADPGTRSNQPCAVMAVTRVVFRTETNLGQRDALLFAVDAR